jgi:pimeloyl-ACP methyl ester carboxylesterase
MTEPRGRRTGLATVHGAQLYYEVAGDGHPLVLLHEGIADCRMWDDQMDAFARGFTVVRYDLRGFGRSDMPPDAFSHRADLASLLDYLGVERAYLLGMSLGGQVATDFAIERPDRVAALVLAGAALGGKQPSEELIAQWKAIDEAAESDGDLARAVEMELRMWVDGLRRTPDQVDPAVRERVRQMDTAIFARAQQPQGEEQRLAPPAIGRLGEIHVPALVMVGDGDQPDVVATADLLARGIAGARKRVLHGVAHVPNMERPQEFNRIVLEFLADL